MCFVDMQDKRVQVEMRRRYDHAKMLCRKQRTRTTPLWSVKQHRIDSLTYWLVDLPIVW